MATKQRKLSLTKSRIFVISALLISTLIVSPAFSSDKRLFYVFQASDGAKNSLSHDQVAFYDSSPPSILSLSTHRDIYKWFNSQISFMSDGAVNGNPDKVETLSLLDNNYKLILVDSNETLAINNKNYTHEETFPGEDGFYSFIHVSEAGSVESSLNDPARSFYRLSSFLGLAKINEDIKSGINSVSLCLDMIGNKYACDTIPNGPFSIVGKSLIQYSAQCHQCDVIDKSILSMVAAHHLLRAADKNTREKGIRIFRENEKKFIDIDENFRQLKDIYLVTLTQ